MVPFKWSAISKQNFYISNIGVGQNCNGVNTGIEKNPGSLAIQTGQSAQINKLTLDTKLQPILKLTWKKM